MLDRPRGSDGGYSAFISYSHRDRRAAALLAARLERYRLPRPLARKLGFRRLRPVFRDRDELRASHDLGAAVSDAIARSGHLIVLCSRNTPRSEWVGREIALFRALHGDDRILTAAIEQAPGSFHPALLQRTDGRTAEPLAADFTRAGDGARLALLKLIAPMAGVGLDELVGRDAQRRVRQTVAMAVAAVLLVVAAAVAALVIARARAEAAAERARGADAMQYQLTRLRAAAKARGSLDLARTVNDGVERFQRSGVAAAPTLADQLQRAELLQARAEDDEQRGDFGAAGRHAAAAFAASAALLRAHPAPDTATFRHAQSAYWRGLVAWRTGDVAGARRDFRLYARLADALARLDPAKVEWRLEQGYANSNLGMLALREARDWPLARRRFLAAQAAFAAASQGRPGDADIRYELADGEAWLADVERLRGDLATARAHRQAQRRTLSGLLARDPANALYRTDLVSNGLGLARISAAEGRAGEAIAELERARATVGELHRGDPANSSVARQKRAVELFLVETWLSLPPARRPARRAVDAYLDCEPDWQAAGGEEVAAFCTLLAARRDLQAGRRDLARTRLASPRAAAALRSGALSPRWRLNFAAERAALERAIGPAKRKG